MNQKTRLSLLVLGLLFSNAMVFAQPGPEELPDRGMWSEQPAKRWQEAMVTGNGTLGAMVFGDPKTERIVLNHERLYEPLLDSPCPVPDIADALPEVRRLLLSGQYQEGYAHSYQTARDAGFPGIQWTDPYHPACALTIDQSIAHAASNYWRSTDFLSGEVVVHWSNGEHSVRRRTFASRTDGVIVCQIQSENTLPLQGHIRLVNQDRRPANQRQDEFGGGYHDPLIEAENGFLTYRCQYAKSKRGYVVVARVVGIQSETSTDSEDASIAFGGSEVIVLIAIESLEDFADVDAVATRLRTQLSDLDPSYTELRDRHRSIHGEMMSRVRLDLGSSSERLLSNEALIRRQKSRDRVDPVLLEKMFDMGRYGLISSSGKWPPNLMGIWNGDWRPKWSGDFTLDANVNLQIAGAVIGQLPEATKAYGDMLNGLQDDWAINAEHLFGCRGVLAGTRTDGRHNRHTHFSPGFPGHFWTAGAQWLVLPMFEHYQATGDEQYLREEVLPMMSAIVDFYEDFLSETDAHGKVVFVPSYSPENRPLNTKCPASINATMDIACAKEALVNLLSVRQIADLDDATCQRLEQLLAKLPDYRINDSGALAEWAWPGLTDNDNHRHVSHLYPVWPGHEIHPDMTPDLFLAAKKAAQNRGRGNGSAHGLAHMALIGCRLRDAELVQGNLKFMLSNDYLLPSLFTFHNPKRIYNADMLHSLPAVVMEMLVYSRPASQDSLPELELLPATNADLSSGSIQGMVGRNQTVLETVRWDLEQRTIELTIRSKQDQELKILHRLGMSSLVDSTGRSYPVQNHAAVVRLRKGETQTFRISWND